MTNHETAKDELKKWYGGDKDPAHIEQAEYFFDRAIEELLASRDSRILSAVPSELPALISDLIEYFEPLADADASGDPLEYRGNMEMSLLTRLQEIERGIAG